MDRPPGPSVRLKLTLSYTGFLMVAAVVLLTAVWVFLLRYVPTYSEQPASGDLFRGASPSQEDLVRAFVPAAAWALLALLVFGLVGGWLLAGRMLAPLARITHATRRAASGSLSHRVELDGRQDEFRELADSFDTMLGRLEAQVAEQQRFAANASHELRTPLAITRTLLDVAARDPQDRDDHVLVERLQAVNQRAIDLTEALLILSRADQRSFARERVDLSLVAEEAVETLLPLAEKNGVAIQTSGEIATASGSRALLLQLTMNLLHNAIVHNVAAGGVVWVTASADNDGVSIDVANTGEELDPRMIPLLTERFQRGSDRTRTDHAGVGLGLAIVKSITDAHGGTLSIAPRAGGGLRVTVRLSAVLVR
ncbi:HAMP domain-containing histidine kinase [Glaciibacter flavus]|uniref:histidine kinase n=1 Tax=Orlajensenia flava TaxID=2565934 RepID=A0A4S4FYE8_9MICO|nr:HAMP domain-containing sensor histidine kinase [Glaciibacter flavus]THG35644.1 HAMP domain-containing histidine kinase [Glaciibacter flavus]